MCGILGYKGTKNGVLIVHEGLKALSYRGYDSWGMAALVDNKIIFHKQVGDITKTNPLEVTGMSVIGHTRWATHGGVTAVNAHPHTNKAQSISVVHNGIIENYNELREELQAKGYIFTSETDTEVIPHLIDFYMKEKSYEKAFTEMLKRIEGSYAILAMHEKEGLMFARNGSPLILGIGKDEYFISSDIPSFLNHTKKLSYLEDGDYGRINEGLTIYHNGKKVERDSTIANWDIEVSKKGTYPHFMIKEIEEQPLTIRKALNQTPERIEDTIMRLKKASNVFLVGCGTSYNTCATATAWFAKAGIPTTAILGSEFTQIIPFLNKKTVVIAVSQSGETADVIDAVKVAKQKGTIIIGIVNVPSSTVSRLADLVLPMNSGPELCVLSTKTCTSQLSIFALLANALEGKDKSILTEAADSAFHVIRHAKETMPLLAKKLSDATSMFVIGRNALSHIAREAALKIKEVSYIHAEGMPAGELKHGSIALISPGMPVIVFADDETRSLVTSNAMEVKARGAYVIGVDSKPNPAYDTHIMIPEFEELTPLLALLPIQLLSYYLALERNCDPDKPRNLAKSVTVR